MLRPGFTGSPLDRADALRNDPEAFAAACSDWRARLLRLDGIDPALGDDGRLTWGSLAEAGDGCELLLLGLIDGRPHFAALDYAMPEGATRSMGIFRTLDVLPPEDASTYAGARSPIDWHLRHRFCAKCGSGDTAIHRAGWGRKCANCGTEHFPRVDPVVIMLAEHDGKLLLGRQYHYPPRRYSALAGFVEVGETIEDAVARELREESGIEVADVTYLASQPWPFPSSLMIGCTARALGEEISIDFAELEDARWFTRDEVAAAIAGSDDAPYLQPPPHAIARTLLERWLAS
jgi:NAD+ diphosphatase